MSTVRELAGAGTLAVVAAAATGDDRRRLRIEAYELLHRLVFEQLTRKVETRRGHLRCAVSVQLLADDCLDRFHDDMDAVLDDLFRHARTPIRNLEGWVRRRLRAATVDAHRRRRGERGAQQRPRLPGWLADRLDHDTRLGELAVSMLEFVGVEQTAGLETWPVDAWAARRCADGAGYEAARRAVLRDVATVLTAMRTRPAWYDDYVERPLGRKRAPLLPAPRTTVSAQPPQPPRRSALVELSGLAITAIETRLAGGEEPRAVLVDVLTTVFGRLSEVDSEDDGADDRVLALLDDAASVDRLVADVLAILRHDGV
ncbi:hypothetical protein BLA60_21570 [Actinophytocola xinjiangensis]|uniref:Uncharacterized protein n=1 Tax=Actinophytocola xinjiangensis TaxID=485602 RepID=A0A7Z1AXH6_9PSEU|nr:hypothetical protein [Actinophytocola xinjiangensis]OLF09163.1 hypothetical protein BLA60_21570 [Actinophytocola xinjiangensis]